MAFENFDQLPPDAINHLPKHVRLKYALEARIAKLPAGSQLPSISSLQAEFALAQGTVVRVLRQLQNEGLIEGRHGSGFFATGQRQLCSIGIYFSIDIMAPETGIFPRLLLKGLERAAGQFKEVRYHHYFAAASDCEYHDRVCSLEHDVRRRLVDGVILFGHYGGQFANLPVPQVAWLLPPHVQAHVMVDEEAMVRLGLTALRERGCRTVAYLADHTDALPPADSPYFAISQHQLQIRDFFLREAKRLGLQTRPEWLAAGSGETGVTTVTADATGRFHAIWNAAKQKPDGLLSLDDYRTRGALAAMAEIGLVPGKDLHVASHVNRGSPVLDDQPVIRLEVDPDEIALALLKTVTALIAGQTKVPDLVLVPPHWV